MTHLVGIFYSSIPVKQNICFVAFFVKTDANLACHDHMVGCTKSLKHSTHCWVFPIFSPVDSVYQKFVNSNTSRLVVGLGWKHQQAGLSGLFNRADLQFMSIEFTGQKTGKFHLCALYNFLEEE